MARHEMTLLGHTGDGGDDETEGSCLPLRRGGSLSSPVSRMFGPPVPRLGPLVLARNLSPGRGSAPNELGWHQFDLLAPAYDRWYETPLGAFVDRLERRAILDLLEAKPGELISDVGSGTGRYVRELSIRGVRAIGVEPSGAMVACAPRAGRIQRPAYARGIAERVPLASGAFDAVLCVAVLEFLSDVDAALAEASRVAKPGGRLVLGVLHDRGPWAAIRRRSTKGVWRNARFFDRGQLEQRLRSLGRVRSCLVAHVPPLPSRTPRSFLPVIDRVWKRIAPSWGAFLAIRVDLQR